MGRAVNSIGYNFQSDGSCAFDATGDIEDDWGAAGLADLGRYGSLTPVHRHFGWALHNSGAPRASTSTDQHGDARVSRWSSRHRRLRNVVKIRRSPGYGFFPLEHVMMKPA